MARLCLPALNAINADLTFTAEVASDFGDRRLPTLDFSLWMNSKQEVTHSYYEKAMKTQLMLEKDSAMSMRQKYTILSNELTRRLYNIDDEEDNFRIVFREELRKQEDPVLADNYCQEESNPTCNPY